MSPEFNLNCIKHKKQFKKNYIIMDFWIMERGYLCQSIELKLLFQVQTTSFQDLHNVYESWE